MLKDGYIRTAVGAVVNVDNGALEAYKRKKMHHAELHELKKKIGEIDSVKEELTEIKGAISEILTHVKQRNGHG